MVEHYRTKYGETAKPTENPVKGYVAREIGMGRAFKTADNSVYVVDDKGALRRVGKKRGSKKDQRRARAKAKLARVTGTPSTVLVGTPVPLEPDPRPVE